MPAGNASPRLRWTPSERRYRGRMVGWRALGRRDGGLLVRFIYRAPRLALPHDQLRLLRIGKPAAKVAHLAGDDFHRSFFQIAVVANLGNRRHCDDGKDSRRAQYLVHSLLPAGKTL